MRYLRFFLRAGMAFVHDTGMAALSFVLSLYLRLGESFAARFDDALLLATGVFTLVAAASFYAVGLYRGIWRYASLSDLTAITRAVTLALLVFLAVTFFLTRLEAVPRGALIINWFVLIALLGAPRMIYRVLKDKGFEHLLERRRPGIPVLLVGANDAAELFLREYKRNPNFAYEPLSMVGITGKRTGRMIHGLKVEGAVDDIPRIIERLSDNGRPPQRLILTRDVDRPVLEKLLEIADSNGISLARLPKLSQLRAGSTPDGSGSGVEIQPIPLEDLLGRKAVRLDRGAMDRLVRAKRVLVTGAGGSIGAELVRQLLAFEPSELLLFDISEYNLYSLTQELSGSQVKTPWRSFLGDVRNREKLNRLLGELRPEIVFHAAALKHVPLAEDNIGEAILTNVVGTKNLADAARAAGAAAVVMVSTDKAVHPVNAMGATKRLAESYCQALDLESDGTRFITVRFGNVLGSTGSVVPLFQRQLSEGGPLTVTDPHMVRYFMSVEEAVQLILQAAAMELGSEKHENSGRIYVLEMGEPIAIVDLARQMIRLAGLRPDKDVQIVFTGPRPGEKLRERLFHEAEEMLPTDHPSLHLASPRTADLRLLMRGIDDLEALSRRGEDVDAQTLLGRLVPEYGQTAITESAAKA
ncbi:polysaccharide biosynthesis protein [Limibacillus halophilus]|uniref:O-antigen biosynthesis protein WbqV n=1 Tax=Limibacillus halophilus TaxID=1579333 RepID=A0A839SSJ6_9PROT|nr:nucleoside-diphosphate sugar epimerase/dehydratase [Limibacillus halophilus]MBB3063883.1 O-antigen biosynthesis protein WbqV [Limibacillus halophilus]